MSLGALFDAFGGAKRVVWRPQTFLFGLLFENYSHIRLLCKLFLLPLHGFSKSTEQINQINPNMKNHGVLTIVGFFLCTLLMASCAPKVVSDVFTTGLAPQSPDSVRVFQLREKVPEHSKAIGQLKVVDNGLSVKGSYDRVLKMAIDETAKCGGNGLVLTEHRVPDSWSTIHRLWGTMLYMEQTASDSVAEQSVKRALARSKYETSDLYQNEWVRFQERKQTMPLNLFRVAIGPSWLASKYELNNRVYTKKRGADFDLDIEHLWKSGFGIGVNAVHNYTSFEEGVDMYFNYIGPSLVLAYMFTDKCRFDMGFGLGLGVLKESSFYASDTNSRLSTMLKIGVEYMASDRVGLGLQMNALTMRMKKPDDVVLEKNEFYGIQRAGVQLSFNYYFKNK